MRRLLPALLPLVCLPTAAFAANEPEGRLQVRAVFTGTYSVRETKQTADKVGAVNTSSDRRNETSDRLTLIFTGLTTWKYRDHVPFEMHDRASISCAGKGTVRNVTKYVTAVNKEGAWAPYRYAATEDGTWTYSAPSEPANPGAPPLMGAAGSVVVVPPVGMYTIILNPYPNISQVSRAGSWTHRLRPKGRPGEQEQEDREFPIDGDHIPPGDPRAAYLVEEAWREMGDRLNPGAGIQGTFDPAKGNFTVSGHLSERGGPGAETTRTPPVNDGDRRDSGLQMVTTANWTADVWWSFTYDQSPCEVIITPVGDYRKWVPAAGAKPGRAGNTVGFKAVLRDKQTRGKPKDMTATFNFKLLETSQEPGSCLNSPFGDDLPDLRIAQAQNAGLAEVADDGQSARSKDKLTECPITISCHDGGASGKLQVVADLSDGRTIVGHLEDTGEELVVLPHDEDGNHIADAWEEEKGVKGQAGDVDDEQDPPGDRTNGDGLTLWEEYRGFLERGKHIRGNPQKKDYFVCDTLGGRVKPGISLFKNLSGLEVHSDLTLEELGTSRVINRNHGDRPHVVDQHGILLGQRVMEGTCEAIGGPGTPKDIIEVVIDPNVPTTTTIDGRSYNYLASTVAHELFHACNVWHHGECDRTVWWQAVVGADGTKALREYDDPSEAGQLAKGLPVVPRQENGVRLKVDFWDDATFIWLGNWNGQHSGHDDCVMRYDCARAYPDGGRRVYLQPTQREKPGFSLCHSPNGTGVNVKGRTPRSRYGDAAGERGNCADQIRVKDPF